METQDRPQAETVEAATVEADSTGAESAEAWRPPRWLKVLGVVGFSGSFVIHLLRGRWVTAAFFVATGLLFLLGREVDRWPKPRRYLFIVVYVALGIAMLAEMLWQVRALL